MKKYQISASIVAYDNDARDILSAVRSVLASPLRVKCTVVDNSPTPVLRATVAQSDADYIYVGSNIGFGAGHNLVLRTNIDDSEYHLVLNPDVSFSASTLTLLYEFVESQQDIGLAMPQILYPDGKEQRLCKRIPAPLDLLSRRFLGKVGSVVLSRRLSRYELRDVDMNVVREIPCLSGCFMLLKTAALREVGLFDERYFMYMEDVDLCRRVGLRYKTVFYPGAEVTHGYAKGSYSNKTLLKYHMQSAFKYFRKWGWILDPDRRRLNKRISPLRYEPAGRESNESHSRIETRRITVETELQSTESKRAKIQ